MLPVLAAVAGGYAYQKVSGHALAHPFRRPAWLWALAAVVLVFGVGRNCGLFQF